MKHEMAVWMELANHSLILIDKKGNFYQFFDLNKIRNPALTCKDLCGLNLKRPHFTCLHCRLRKVRQDKLPNLIPIDIHFWSTRKGRSLAFLKDQIIKKLATIIEWLGD